MTLNEYLIYAGGISSILIVLLCLLLWFLCGESVGDLNLKGSTWWVDALASVLLAAVTLAVHTLTSGPLQRILPLVPDGDSGLGNLFSGLARNLRTLVTAAVGLALLPVPAPSRQRTLLIGSSGQTRLPRHTLPRSFVCRICPIGLRLPAQNSHSFSVRVRPWCLPLISIGIIILCSAAIPSDKS